MTTRTTDPYYSRTSSRSETVDRADPVVWGSAAGPLSNSETEQFRQQGFLFYPGLFSGHEVDELLAEAKHLAADWPADRAGLVREPDSDVVRSVFRLHRYSDLYRRIFRDERLVGRTRQLLNSDVYVHQSRINYKPALDGREFFWHSDFETWHVEDGMPRMRAVSVSIFLSESHEFNGPLMLIPGSQQSYVRCAGKTPDNHFEESLRRQRFGVPPAEVLEDMVARGGIVAPKGPAGSVVLFECNVMHGSSGNLSPTPRTNLFAVYNSVHNQLVSPFCDQPPRPDYLAEREVVPIEPSGETSAD
ncbi:MAG: phytanoyl-CoA dioxygenase family protein [Fuerstiella sp.]